MLLTGGAVTASCVNLNLRFPPRDALRPALAALYVVAAEEHDGAQDER